MNCSKLLLFNRALIFSAKRIYAFRGRTQQCLFNSCDLLDNTQTRTMSQKSIMSFFKATPRKPNVKKENEEETFLETSPSSQNGSPVSKGQEKRTSKRQRLESSDSGSESPKNMVSPVTSTKKKPHKRQRIESSESESESPPPVSPKINQEKVLPPVSSPEDDTSKENLKNITNGTKSPKSKKNPVKKSTKTKIKKEQSPKTVKTEVSPSSKTDEKPRPATMFLLKGNKDEPQATGVVSEEKYDPGKENYEPVEHACWAEGSSVPYLALARTLEIIESTSARLRIIRTLSNLLRSILQLSPADLLPTLYLCLNQLKPAYHGLELGIAETYLMKAIGACTGQTLAQVRVAARSQGLAEAAMSARSAQTTLMKPRPLTVRAVYEAFLEIANMTGQASVNKKIAKIQTLYTACRHSEAKYLIRSLEGKLRIGLAEQSVLAALGSAVALTRIHEDGKKLSADDIKAAIEQQTLEIKTAYCECPDYSRLVDALAHRQPLEKVCRMMPGVPVKPMLAHPARGVQDLFARFEDANFTCEFKYDGERAQIHVPCKEGEGAADVTNAQIFSRNQENHTSKYPDVLSRLPALLGPGVKSCVLDAEAVAYDTVNKKILPFQILSTRKRKDAVSSEISVQVCVFVFDLLLLNGEPLVRHDLRARRELLREHFNEVPGEWHFAQSMDCSSVDEVQTFLEESLRGQSEGLMVKRLDGELARYDIARRSRSWLKLKKDYMEGIGDSIDAVVIGAWYGKGRRAGLLGGFLLAARDPGTEELQTLCRVGTGFSDENLQTFTEELKPLIIDSPKAYYSVGDIQPDVWFSAAVVWEVRCADLSLSPSHRAAAGLVDPDRGVSLRFPRFVRVRTDKTPEQATSSQQIADLYLSQETVRSSAQRKPDIDDFY